MMFLNAILLIGGAAMAAPIIIHILNRRRARVVDWGAMMFLAESLASRNRRVLIEEILLMLLRCLLLGALAFALARPFVTARILAGSGRDGQDVVIVLDGSRSMTLTVDGKSNFARAIEEAHQVVRAARRGDAVAIVVGGPVATVAVASPLSNREALHRALDEQTAPGGSMDALAALQEAVACLAKGSNPAKKIILLTDGQSVGWDLSAERRWDFLAKAAEGMPTQPVVIVRTLDAPRKWHNLCLAELSFSRSMVGTDRPVTLTATVANTADGEADPEAIEFSVDGEVIETVTVVKIAEGASASATVEHRFETPGPHVVAARVLCQDDLPADNRAVRAVDVLDRLPLLIIEGRPSAQPLGAGADYLASALAPDPDKPGDKTRDVFVPRTVAAADVATVKSFSEYPVVVLAGAPRLPADVAARLVRFVADGGGLLVAPADNADRSFYDNWTAHDGKPLLGCTLTRIANHLSGDQADGQLARIDVNSLDHPSLIVLADPAANDLAAGRFSRHWVLKVAGDERTVTIAARLDGGDPYLLQRECGRGRVMTLAAPLDKTFSDLPLRMSFTPLVQELVCHLASPSQRPLSLLPGQQFLYSAGTERPADASVIGPDGRRAGARLEQRGGRWLASYAMTARPGLYRLALPDREVPFVVADDPQESYLTLLDDADYARAGRYVRLVRAATLSELTAAIAGGVPGKEIWRTVAVALLALLALEVLATRLISVRRKAHEATAVRFGVAQVDAERFRSAARDALESAPARVREANR